MTKQIHISSSKGAIMKKISILCVMMVLFAWGSASGYSEYASTSYATLSSDGLLNIPTCEVAGEFWSIRLQITSWEPILLTVVDATPSHAPTSDYSTVTEDLELLIPELELDGHIWSCVLELVSLKPQIVFHLYVAETDGFSYNYYHDEYYYSGDYYDDSYGYGGGTCGSTPSPSGGIASGDYYTDDSYYHGTPYDYDYY